MFSRLYLYFPEFFWVWKIAGQISRLSRIQDCVQTLYLKFKKRISTESKIFRQSTKHLRLQSGEERTCLCMQEFLSVNRCYLHGAGLAQSVQRLTAEREVAGSIPRTGPTLRLTDQQTVPYPSYVTCQLCNGSCISGIQTSNVVFLPFENRKYL